MKYFSYSVREVYAYLLLFFSEFTFFVILPYLSIVDELNGIAIGGLLAASMVLESVLMLVFSSKISKIHSKTLHLISVGLMVVAWSMLVIGPKVAGLVAFYLVVAVAKALARPFSRSALLKFTPQQHKGRVFHNISLVQNSAVFAAPLVGTLAVEVSRDAVFITILGVYVALFFLAFVIFDKASPYLRGAGTGFFSGIVGILRKRAVLTLSGSMFFGYLVMGLFISGTVLIPEYRFDLAPFVGAFFSTVGLGIIVWQLFLRRFIPEDLQRNSAVLIALGLFSSLFFAAGLSLSFAALISYAVYEAIMIPAIYDMSARAVEEPMQNLAFSSLIISANLGDAVGTLAGGFIIESVASPKIVLLLLAMVISTISVKLLFKAKS